MADSYTRRNVQLKRLRQRLQEKRESLADQFNFKMYIVFHFKEEKPAAVYEADDIVTVMTNNYEESILKEAKDDADSIRSSMELLEKDIVQFHVAKWHSLRKDVLGATTTVDFFLWPRKDIDRIECLLFSCWKGVLEPFKPLQANFQFAEIDYGKQLSCMVGGHGQSDLIINNPEQTFFLFVDRCNLQAKNRKTTVFKLSSLCIYLPQDKLLSWQPRSVDEVMKKFEGS